MKKSNAKLLLLTIVLVLALVFTVAGCTFLFSDAQDADKNARYVVTSVSADQGSESRALEDVIADIQPTVVEIYCTLSSGTGAGSGVIVGKSTTEDGEETGSIIITNHHVIEDATRIVIKLYDGSTYEATLVGSDFQTDIAVLRISATGLKTATWIDNSDSVRVGSTAIVIGNPLGILGGTVTKGIVSALARDISVDGQSMTLMQTDASINSGNSGGGLFNSAGNLVGIVNAKFSSSASDTTTATIEGLGFAIPKNTAYPIMSELLETAGSEQYTYGYIAGRYRLGITIGYNNYKTQMGIAEIDTNGDAYKAGLRANDMFASVTVGDKTATDLEGMLALLSAKDYTLGQQITVVYKQQAGFNSYTTKTVTITLTQYVYKMS